jgi:hypothetical protein
VNVGRRIVGGVEMLVFTLEVRPPIIGGMIVVVVDMGVVRGIGAPMGMAERGRRADIADQDDARQDEAKRFRPAIATHGLPDPPQHDLSDPQAPNYRKSARGIKLDRILPLIAYRPVA